MPLLGTNAANCAEAGIRYVVIRIPIAGNIENIEEVSTETNDVLLAKYVEVLEERRVDATVAGGAFRAIVRRSECERRRCAVSTSSIVNTGCDCGRNTGRGRRIGSPPILERTIPDDHWAVLISPAEAPTAVVRIAVVGAEHSDWKSRIQDRGGRNSPSSKDRIEAPVNVVTVSFSVSKR